MLMAASASGQPSLEGGPLVSYFNLLKQPKEPSRKVPIKLLSYLHGEPQVIWEQEEVEQIIVNENLEYAVIGNSPMVGLTYKS